MFEGLLQLWNIVRLLRDFTQTRQFDEIFCPLRNFSGFIARNSKSYGIADWRELQ